MSNPSRQWVELTILANSILIPGDGVKAVETLEPTHFANLVHRKMFAVLQACHAQGKIMPEDFMTAILRENLPVTSIELCDILRISLFHTNTFRLCLTLIELNMREAFAKLLEPKAKEAVLSGQHEVGEMYQSCTDTLRDPAKDIFDHIPIIRQYLEQYVPEELEEYRDLEAKIPKMIRRVKSQERAKRLIESFETLSTNQSYSTEHRQALQALKNIILMLLGNFALPPDLIKKIHLLNQTLWEPLPSDPSTSF